MLGYDDIKRELGKNIFIHPLNLKNIKGNSINLTASDLAWSLKDRKSIVSNGKISIPPYDTGLIQSAESIYISHRLGGTFHSQVGWVSKGSGHIGTLLDPDYSGTLLIAIHNHRDSPLLIDIGERFVTLALYYLKTKSSSDNTNEPQQKSKLLENDIMLSPDESHSMDIDWKKEPQPLKQAMLESDAYRDLVQERLKRFHSLRNILRFLYIFLFPIIILLLVGLIINLTSLGSISIGVQTVRDWYYATGLSGAVICLIVFWITMNLRRR